MKKSLSVFIVSMLCVLNVSASDFYIRGGSVNGNEAWSSSDYKFESQGNNQFTIDLESLSGEFKIYEKGDGWSNWCGYAANQDWPVLTYGSTTYVRGGGYADDPSDSNIKVDGTLKNITLKLTTNAGDNLWSLEVIKKESQDQPVNPDVTFYFHAKNDYVVDGDKAYVPVCRLITDDSDLSLTLDNGTKMQCVNDTIQLYSATFKGEDVAAAHDIVFGFKDAESNDLHTYRAGCAPDGSNYVWDKDNWTKYIYATRSQGTETYACQAWLSYNEYKALSNTNPDKLHFVGNFSDRNWDLSSNIYTQACENGEQGLFYFDISKANLSSSEPRFKVSSMYPATGEYSYDGRNDQTVNYRRWATFDLGILGLDQNHAVLEGKDVTQQVSGQDVRDSKMQAYMSLPFNRLNQFNWYVTDFSNGKYIIIDMHADCRTLTLVNFEPNPTVTSIEQNAASVVTLTAQQQQQLGTPQFKASKRNGGVYIDRVNVMSGKVGVNNGAVPDDYNTYFTVDVQPWMNGTYLGSFHVTTEKGFPTGLTLDYLAPDADNSDEIGLRNLYTSISTGLTFHSRRSTGTYSNTLSFAAPTTTDAEGQYINYGDECWGAGAQVKVDYPESSSLAMYADYEITGGDDYDYTFLVDANHWMYDVANHPFGAKPAWQRQGNDTYDDSKHNWAKIFATTGANLPVYIHNVAKYYDTDGNVTTPGGEARNYYFNAIAVYPFLVNPNATLTATYDQPVVAEKDIYLVGDVENNSWFTNPSKFTKQDDGTYTLTAKLTGRSFRIGTTTSSTEFNNDFYRVEADDYMVAGTYDLGSYQNTSTDNQILMDAGTWTFTISSDRKSITLSRDASSDATKTYYITGGIEGCNWDVENPVEFTRKADGTYYCAVNFNQSSHEFKMSCAKGDWTAFDGSIQKIAYNGNIPEGVHGFNTDNATWWQNSVCDGGMWYITIAAGGDKIKFSRTARANKPARAASALDGVDLTGFAVNPANAKTAFKIHLAADATATGVDNIANDDTNAPVELYTLQGVRVQGQPAPGLYISRQGNTTRKVIIR